MLSSDDLRRYCHLLQVDYMGASWPHFHAAEFSPLATHPQCAEEDLPVYARTPSSQGLKLRFLLRR